MTSASRRQSGLKTRQVPITSETLCRAPRVSLAAARSVRIGSSAWAAATRCTTCTHSVRPASASSSTMARKSLRLWIPQFTGEICPLSGMRPLSLRNKLARTQDWMPEGPARPPLAQPTISLRRSMVRNASRSSRRHRSTIVRRGQARSAAGAGTWALAVRQGQSQSRGREELLH